MSSRDRFGARLRRERERRGVSLEEIAKATKVCRGLYEGLERDDLSRWPHGIFRRSFFREYVVAIGLDPEPLLEEFLALFPESGEPVMVRTHLGPRDLAPLRITLVPEHWVRRLMRPVVAAAGDAGLVLLAAQALARVAGLNSWTAIGMVALVYYTLGTLIFSRSVVAWGLSTLLSARRSEIPASGVAPDPAAAVPRDWTGPAVPRVAPPEPVIVVAAVAPELERSA